MTPRLKLFAVVGALALVIVACGGTGGDTGADQSPGPDSESQNSESQNSGSPESGAEDNGGGSGDPDDGSADGAGGDDGSGTDTNGAPSLDPGDMPAAGEAVLEVGGQTFTIRAAEMDYFICDISDDFVNVRSESETEDLGMQYDPVNGVGNANLTPAGSDVQYNSFFRPESTGGVAVEAPYIVYEARFDTSTADDPFNADDVGVGRLSVTCP